MTYEYLYDFAVGLLAKRDYSSGEMRRRLAEQSDDETMIELVMERLLSFHYLDDYRLAEKEIEKHLHQYHGLLRIKQVLRSKGLDSLTIEQALEDTDVDWVELCLELIVKQFGEARPRDKNEKAKMTRYQQHSGHTLPVIFACLG
ncbi:regulatory protein RecX (plasmid) [Vibrio scophthalmi]|uniref:regulatory protein RecX n=1 Tax=Vibrio scophthalmi TaxID=45658 RepID=UPI00080922FA|nr:regulatory protein RecX [Vibrio scophthalmi]ANS88156.1 Regulatory protein RecX [Vibrio scophthalmi]